MSTKETKGLNLKIVLIGDSNVGKTTLLYKYLNDENTEDITPTLGLDNKVKTSQIKGIKTKIQLWDTVGQEKFNSLTQNIFQNTDGILIIFDLTNKESFTNIQKWISKSDKNIKTLIVGNKSDLVDNRQVTKEEIKLITQKYNYVEVSALNGINVDKAFNTLLQAIVGKKTDEELFADFGINDPMLSLSGSTINNINGKPKKKCCIS